VLICSRNNLLLMTSNVHRPAPKDQHLCFIMNHLNPDLTSHSIFLRLLLVFYFCYSTAKSVWGQYRVGDSLKSEYGAVGLIRTGRGNRLLGENLLQRHFVHHESHMA
jgi:hypothetical protein